MNRFNKPTVQIDQVGIIAFGSAAEVVSRVGGTDFESEPVSPAIWFDTNGGVDVHGGFRGSFVVEQAGPVEFKLLGASVFRVWLDGEHLTDGPIRFAANAPEYLSVTRWLAAGKHLVAAHVHAWGVRNRVVPDVPPFLFCRVVSQDRELPVGWRAKQLTGFVRTGIRTSPLLGWVEWCDTEVDGEWWRPAVPDEHWSVPVVVDTRLSDAVSAEGAVEPPRLVPAVIVASGTYRDAYTGYPLDDPSIQFVTAELAPEESETPDGVWSRYDLGRVRNGTVRIEIDTTDEVEVVIGQGERLYDGRVVPVFPLSAGRTCVLARFRCGPGQHRFETLNPQSARYIELRVRSRESARVSVGFSENDQLGEPLGAFSCSDPVLDRIWHTGIETLRACAADVLMDSPRERALWIGDAVTVGFDILSSAYPDMRLIRRALMQAAALADTNGFVAGCIPGDPIYVGTYAAHWLVGLAQYGRVTGDLGFIDRLYQAARTNVEAIRRTLRDDGSFPDLPWPFIDWGRPIATPGPDLALLLIVLEGVRGFRHCADMVDAQSSIDWAHEFESELMSYIRRLVDEAHDSGWEHVDFHSRVLALRSGVVGVDTADLVSTIKEHAERSFPSDPDAPRLRDPSMNEPRSFTPFFAHFALDALLRCGESDFVLAQWKAAWGWMLDRGATTWWESFDDRWSRCHFWSGSPTWQMSRYLLGVTPRWDFGPGHVDYCFVPSALDHAQGRIPFVDGTHADIRWTSDRVGTTWELTATRDLILHAAGAELVVPHGETLRRRIRHGAPPGPLNPTLEREML